MSKRRRKVEEPVMSDRTLLLNVEDLINVAFGPMDGNTVDFKAVQTILHILARELRLLEQDVEIRIDEEKDKLTALHEHMQSGIVSDEEDEVEDEEEVAETKKKDEKKKKEMGEKSSKSEKFEKGKTGESSERAEKKEKGRDGKGEKIDEEDIKRDKPEKGETREKVEKGEKGETREKVEKGEKGERKEKAEKGEGEKSDRKEKGERAEKIERSKRGEKGEKGERDERAEKDERGERSERGEKGEKTGKKRGRDDIAETEADGKGQQEDKDDMQGDKQSGKDRKTRQKTDKRVETDKSQDEDDGRTGSEGTKDKARSKTKQRDGKQGSQEEDSSGARGRGASDDERQKKRGVDKGAGISVSEEIRRGLQGKGEKVLVVEKGPTTRDSRTRVGSIEVVTRSDFDLLESKIQELLSMKGPLPMPTMPDNLELKSALAKGTASLPDTMEAMQVNARVRAAENALTCMADLLTQLAAAGAIPPELAHRVEQMTTEVHELAYAAEGLDRTSDMRGTATETHKSVAIDPVAQLEPGRKPERGHISSTVTGGSLAAKISSNLAAKMSIGGMSSKGVSHSELEEALLLMKTELMSNMGTMTAKNSMTAEHANTMAKAVAEKLDVALKLDDRISNLFSLTKDYAEQLTGFDSGLSTQMKSFQEQMSQMRSDLQAGLHQMEAANNSSESVAIVELRTAYESLVMELETTLHTHSSLVLLQKQLGDELKALLEWVEMLREQKADRDEVKDGLRDKADLSRLKGLLNENAFEVARGDLNKRLDQCYEKFHKQDAVWMDALSDLMQIAGTKAELTLLMGLKDFATEKLKELHDTVLKLEIMLGEPKAALLMRKLSAGAQCGACLTPALMPPHDAHYGMPAPLPALVRDHQNEPCAADLHLLPPIDTREHICNRWVGGSHTLISEHVTRNKATPIQHQGVPTKRYTGYGSDGRLYQLEEELQQCVECNLPPKEEIDDTEPPSVTGDGDHKPLEE